MFATYPVDDVHQVLITKGVDGLEIERGQSKKVCFVFVGLEPFRPPCHCTAMGYRIGKGSASWEKWTSPG